MKAYCRKCKIEFLSNSIKNLFADSKKLFCSNCVVKAENRINSFIDQCIEEECGVENFENKYPGLLELHYQSRTKH